MQIYIDCDGVILDTESHLFDDYDKLKESNPDLKRKIYLQNFNWEKYLETVKDINDALYLLKSFNYNNVDILTKVHSLEEAVAKIAFFRRNNIKNNIIIVPSIVPKSSIVEAHNNILVDNNNENLENWVLNDGYAIYFGNSESNFVKINSLREVLDSSALKRTLRKF